jgi:hypothetical protein
VKCYTMSGNRNVTIYEHIIAVVLPIYHNIDAVPTGGESKLYTLKSNTLSDLETDAKLPWR